MRGPGHNSTPSLFQPSSSQAAITALLAIFVGAAIVVLPQPLTLIISFSAIALLVGALWRPRVLLMAFLFSLVFLQPILQHVALGHLSGVELTAGRVVGATLCLLLLILWLRQNIIASLAVPHNLLFMLIVVYFLVMTVASKDRATAITLWVRLLSGFLVFVVAQGRDFSGASGRNLIAVVFIAVSISAAVTAVTYAGGAGPENQLLIGQPSQTMVTHGVVRSAGVLGHGSGATGALYFVGVLYGIYLWRLGNKRWWVGAGILALIAGAAATFTRSSLLAIVLSLAVLILLEPSFRRRMRVAAAVIVLIAVVVVATFLLYGTEDVAVRLHDIPVLGEKGWDDPSTGSGRIGIWLPLLEYYSASSPLEMLMGHGITSSRYSGTEIDRGVKVYSSHNDYLMLLIEMGALGLALYLAFLVTVYRQLHRAIQGVSQSGRLNAAMGLALLISFSFIVSNFGVTITLAGYRHYFLLLLGVALGRAAALQASQEPDCGGEPAENHL